MTTKELQNRTIDFACRIIKFVEVFPRTKPAEVIAKQLISSACSVGANYRAACRAQSYVHFISKINIVEEEADESQYWIELSIKAELVTSQAALPLLNESKELTAIFTATRKTARLNYQKNKKSS